MNEIELREKIVPVVSQAQSIVISNANEYGFAVDFLKRIKTAKKEVHDFFAPITKKAYESWKAITAKESEITKPLDEAEANIKRKILVYQQEEERKRLEEQRRLQAEAEERARRERERLLKEAEKLKTPELKEARLAQAESIQAQTVVLTSNVPKVEGIAIRKIWKAKVVDKAAFVEAALKDENLLSFIIIDNSALNKLANATKGEIKYPGILFYQEENVMAKTQ